MSAPDTADSSRTEVYRGHVPTVEVSRCGWWVDGMCGGDETGCNDEECMTACRRADPVEDLDVTLEEWMAFPFPTEISHGQFLRDYDRCPKQCQPAEQLTLLDEDDGTD